MNEKQVKLAIGCMLHDTCKALYAEDNGKNQNLKKKLQTDDVLKEIISHQKLVLQGGGSEDSLAYIAHIASNIASASDRRKLGDSTEWSFPKDAVLDSIFNILNEKEKGTGNKVYQARSLDKGINYPVEQNKLDKKANVDFIGSARDGVDEAIGRMTFTGAYVNSLLEALERHLSYLPSFAATDEPKDVSLFDHLKMTAAIASSIYEYLEEQGQRNYSEELVKNEEEFCNKKAFLLFSADFSGIQKFIYGHFGTSDILKNLRARSFYLEIMMENLIDETLEKIGLSRANLLYVGGGHHYMILPNTKRVRDALDEMDAEINAWLRKNFQAELFYATGYQECSANELENNPAGSYKKIFQGVSERISEKKSKRYSADVIRELNKIKINDHSRECAICHRSSDWLERDDEGRDICPVCGGLMQLSSDILNQNFFVVSQIKGEKSLEVFEGEYLIPVKNGDELKQCMRKADYIRSYSKNRSYVGEDTQENLFVGDYHYADTLGELVKDAVGIDRLGVFRADVDNLGQAFVSGFSEDKQTLSRAATFSRRLSIFFKLYINKILKEGEFNLEGRELIEPAEKRRRVAIIYSGGDDVFVAGAWKDVIEFAIDLSNSLKKFTQGKLTISGGIAICDPTYPISYMADITGELEDNSKHYEDGEGKKNAITLFDDDNGYHWNQLTDEVIRGKFATINDFFSMFEDKGKAFLYQVLELFRGQKKNSIHLARLAYVLARMNPEKSADDKKQQAYEAFKKSMYEWMQSSEDNRQTITAIYLYIYLVREKEEKDGVQQ